MKKIFLILTVSALALTSLNLPFTIQSVNAQKQRGSAHAVPVNSQQNLQQLTQKITELYQEAQSADPQQRAELMNQVQTLASSRLALLQSVMAQNPADVLRWALPESVLAALPAGLQTLFERRVQLDGELQVLYEDYDTYARMRQFLNVGSKRYELHSNDEAPLYQSGTRVRVKGVQMGEEIALYSDGNNATTSADSMQLLDATTAPGFNSFGEQRVLVMLVNFSDKATQPYTPATARSVMFDTTNNFDLENSYGQTWLTGDVAGWFTIPTSYTTCDTAAIAYYAKEAATAAGYDVNSYNRHVFAFPSAACGGWSGMAYFGGNPSQAWINGGFSLSVVGHEMGHNFGLYHSKSLDCGSEAIGTVGTGCTSNEYGDGFDIMGTGTRHFNSFQKQQIGWLGWGISPGITTAGVSGNYWIDAYESPGGAKAIRVLKSTDPKTGVKTYYYLEARRAIGFDSSVSSNSNVMNGVIVHQGPETGGTPVYLLDMTPETTSWSDPALMAGKSFTDANANVTITTLSASSSGAIVNVSYGPVPCLHASPNIAMSSSNSGWVAPGSSVNYTVSVTNYDTSGCSGSSFNLQAAVPSGWSASFGSTTLSLTPGATTSTSLTITSPSSVPEGSYNIPVSVLNLGDISFAASTVVNYTAVSSVSVSAVTDRASYTRNQTVSTTATVKAMGKPVASAAVVFTITKADGSKITGTIVTGPDGTAVFKYKFKRTDPVGSYLDLTAATVNGLSGNATTAFVVH